MGRDRECKRQKFTHLRFSTGFLKHKGRLTREKQCLPMCATGITQEKHEQKVTQSASLAPQLMRYVYLVIFKFF